MSIKDKAVAAVKELITNVTPAPAITLADVQEETQASLEPTIIITFPHPRQPMFEFLNWHGVSVGNLEEMTHKMYMAAQQATIQLRHKEIQALNNMTVTSEQNT